MCGRSPCVGIAATTVLLWESTRDQRVSALGRDDEVARVGQPGEAVGPGVSAEIERRSFEGPEIHERETGTGLILASVMAHHGDRSGRVDLDFVGRTARIDPRELAPGGRWRAGTSCRHSC